MRPSPRAYVLGLFLLGVVASGVGLAAVAAGRQAAMRGALNGLPDPGLPRRQPLFGVNADLTQYAPAALAENLDQIQQTGFVWVRQVFDWSAIERTRGQYDWSAYDRIVDEASKRQLRLVAVIWRSPAWAAPSPSAPPEDMQPLGEFASALAARYGDRINVYQIWDEPNLASGWGGQPASPIGYVKMLQITYTAIHRADPTATVLAAGLAPTVETGPDNLDEALFLRALYDNGAAPYFDGVAGKPYGFDTPPDDRRIDEAVLNFSRLVLLREEMERHGDRAKPLWASHFGWNSLPQGWAGAPSIWGQASPQSQADWTALAYRRALTEWPWAGPLIVESWQPNLPPDDPRWGFALKRPDGSLTPAADAIRALAASTSHTLWPGVYDASNPLLHYSGHWEFSDLGADIGQQGDSAIDVPFSGSALAVIARRDNYRATLYVTLDGQPSAALPRDEQGQSYALLSSTDQKPHIDVLTLAAVSDQDAAHSAHIQADRGWDQWAIAGFAVGHSVNTSPYDLLLAALAVPLLAFTALAVREARLLSLPAQANQALTALRARLSDGVHLLLALAAALAAWLGMALTWGGLIPDTLRRVGDGPSLLITAITAGVFYFSPAPALALTLVALAALFVLIYARPPVGLALMMAFTPYYLLPRPLFDRAFSLLEVVTLLTLVAWAIHVVAARRAQGWPSPKEIWGALTGLDKAIAGFIALAVVSLSWAELKGVAVTELRQMVVEPAVMYLVLRTTPLSARERWQIVHLLIATGVIVSGYGFYQFAVDLARSPGAFTCLRGTFGTCNNAALYLTRLIPICAAVVLMARTAPWRWVYGAAGVIMLAAVVLTVSRGGLLFGLPAALAVVVIVWAGRKGVMAVAAGIALELAAVIPLTLYVPRFSNMLDLSSGSSSSFFRTQVWQSAFAMLRDHPLTGVGLDQFLYQYRGRYILPSAWQQPDLSQPHNFLLDYWVRLGILGLVVGVLIHVLFWRMAIRTQRQLAADPPSRALAAGLMGGMAAMVAHGMVDETHFVIELAFILFMTLGLMHQLNTQKGSNGDGDSDQREGAASGGG